MRLSFSTALVLGLMSSSCRPECTPGETLSDLSRSQFQFERADGEPLGYAARIFSGTCAAGADVPKPTRTSVVAPNGTRKPIEVTFDETFGLGSLLPQTTFSTVFPAEGVGTYTIELQWGDVTQTARFFVLKRVEPNRSVEFPMRSCSPPLRLGDDTGTVVCSDLGTTSQIGGVREVNHAGLVTDLVGATLAVTPPGALLIADGGIGWLPPSMKLADWAPAAQLQALTPEDARRMTVAANANHVVFWIPGETADVVSIRDVAQLDSEQAHFELPPCPPRGFCARGAVVSDDTILLSVNKMRQWLRHDGTAWRVAEREPVESDSSDIDVGRGETYWRCGGHGFEFGRLENGALKLLTAGGMPLPTTCLNLGGSRPTASVYVYERGDNNPTTFTLGAFVSDAGVSWRGAAVEGLFYGDVTISQDCTVDCNVTRISWFGEDATL